MLVKKGDKLIVTKDVASFLRTGDVVEVTNVENGIIEFAFGEGMMHMGVMNQAECEAHFTKYVEPNKAQLEKIDELLKGLEQFKHLLLEVREGLQNDCDCDCPCDECCGDCDECELAEEDEWYLDEEEDECLDTDLDCDDCDDYDCPFNRNVYNM